MAKRVKNKKKAKKHNPAIKPLVVQEKLGRYFKLLVTVYVARICSSEECTIAQELSVGPHIDVS